MKWCFYINYLFVIPFHYQKAFRYLQLRLSYWSFLIFFLQLHVRWAKIVTKVIAKIWRLTFLVDPVQSFLTFTVCRMNKDEYNLYKGATEPICNQLTYISLGCRRNLTFMRHKFLVLTVKKWLKSVYIYGSYSKKIKLGVPFFAPP